MVSRTPRLRVCHLWRSTESRTDLARTRSAGKTAIRQFVSVRCDLSRTRRKGESFGLAGQSLRESGKRLLVAKGGSDLRQYAQRAAFSGPPEKSIRRQMSADAEQRKLAAIMFTDMVGYSA